MVKFYTMKENKIVEVKQFVPGALIKVVDPSADEVHMLSSLLQFDSDFIYDSLDEDERARIEIDDDTVLLILKIPRKLNGDSKIPYKTVSLGIVIGPNYTVFSMRNEIEFIQHMIDASKFDLNKRSRMIFQLFYTNAKVFLGYLKEVNKTIGMIEEELHRSMKNKELEEMMYLEKSLVYFTTSLRSNEIMMEKLLRGNILQIYEEDKDVLEDAIIENRQAIEVSNIYSDILAGMMDSYASVISNNLNIVMKILTVVTILMQIPTIITSFYGMNVGLPLQNNPLAYLHIITWSVGTIILTLIWFKRKKWL
ncbi:magnesium transporter CorA family protein [Thermosipho ferrireducens]|uniref:Magnesium transporter CorA family protein n=1 Tax=Thermosipho ferrireducens TaxID=2571116 RepID=A0ABX7S875_9BACT|nr:magnesium transporter CorA family protein [Thermosipho ferrireducens]QTA37488.1 magnesium transporter CorA family protein [Thermosipho ferrireducens]